MGEKKPKKTSFFFKIIVLLFALILISAWTYLFTLFFEETTDVNYQNKDNLKRIIKYVFQATIVYLILKEFGYYLKQFKKNLKLTFNIWEGFNYKKFAECLLVAIGTFLISSLLIKIPFLSKGWTHLLYKEGGSIFISSLIDVENISVVSISISIVFILIFLFLIPHFAYLEEQVFRKHKISLKQRVLSSIIFGLVHCVTGIPLGAGIALIFTGFFYSITYKSAYQKKLYELTKSDNNLSTAEIQEQSIEFAFQTSTIYHSLVNSILFGLILLLLIYLLLAQQF